MLDEVLKTFNASGEALSSAMTAHVNAYLAVREAMRKVCPPQPVNHYLLTAQLTFGVKYENLFSRCRAGHLPLARWCIWEALARDYGMGPNEIAILFNNNHGSVIHARKSLRDRLEGDPKARILRGQFQTLLAATNPDSKPTTTKE